MSSSHLEKTLDEVHVSGVDEVKDSVSNKLEAANDFPADSEKATTSDDHSNSVPDGGLKAWSIVAGSYVLLYFLYRCAVQRCLFYSILIQFCGFGLVLPVR